VGLSYLPAFLMDGRRVVAKAMSNHFGEFILECPQPHPKLRLCAGMADGQRRVEMDISHVLPGSVDAVPAMAGPPSAKS